MRVLRLSPFALRLFSHPHDPGGGRFGGGGGASARPVDTGDYLVTVTAGGQTMSEVIRIVNLGAALNAGGFFGGDEGDESVRR